MAEHVLFGPSCGWVGDVIPLVVDGKFWLYYLHELRNGPESGTAWGLVRTPDFVEFVDGGVGLPAGGTDHSDLNAYTGSVVIDGDKAHLFYTGHNPRHIGRDGVTPQQLVMHAISSDGMKSWEKRPDLTFAAPSQYEDGDWRDPFVFRPSEDEPWHMLVAARHTTGPARRRGLIAQYVSHDLLSWSPAEPFWDPHRYLMLECPEVFRWGDWWYLVFSEFSESFVTRYRMARTSDGPWLVPELDTVDGRAFYAAKSVARDGRRFFVGWIATKEGDLDDGAWQWAGTMSVLEAQQEPDGTLSFSIPREIRESFTRQEPISFVDHASTDGAARAADSLTLTAPDGYQALVSRHALPSQFLARVTIDIAAGATECGLLIRSSRDGDESYALRLEPKRHRVVFDRWPRRRTGGMQWQISGDQPYAIELERPCALEAGRHEIDLLVDDSICIAVVDRKVVLSARMYDRRAGYLGLCVGEGSVTFSDLRIYRRD